MARKVGCQFVIGIPHMPLYGPGCALQSITLMRIGLYSECAFC